MTYVPYYGEWKNWPNISTPITAAAMQHIEDGIAAGTGGIPDPVPDPITVDLDDPTAGFAQTFDYSGEDNWEGAIKILVKDVDTISGSGYVIRVIDEDGDQVFDLDAYGSMFINARGSGTGGIGIEVAGGTFNVNTLGDVTIQGASDQSSLAINDSFSCNRSSGTGKVGFYTKAATAIPQQTGVAVNAAGIHAALVNLGLITA